jgi:hypothetical protein
MIEGAVAHVSSHAFCAITVSIDENQIAGATSHDGRHCASGANRPGPNYSDLLLVSSPVRGFSAVLQSTGARLVKCRVPPKRTDRIQRPQLKTDLEFSDFSCTIMRSLDLP